MVNTIALEHARAIMVAFATCNKIELTGGKDVGNYLGQAYVELYKKIEEVIKAST